MAFLKVKCGTIKIEGLLSVSIEKLANMGYYVTLHYLSLKDPIRIKCKGEAEAQDCYDEISKVLIDSE